MAWRETARHATVNDEKEMFLSVKFPKSFIKKVLFHFVQVKISQKIILEGRWLR